VNKRLQNRGEIMPEKKKEWVRPRLTVLTRGDRAERVLTTCKMWPGGFSGPRYQWLACDNPPVVGGLCYLTCHIYQGS